MLQIGLVKNVLLLSKELTSMINISLSKYMNLVAMTIISPQKEYFPSRESNQQPPVLKLAMLPTELCILQSYFFSLFSHCSLPFLPFSSFQSRVLRGSVVECLTRNPGVLGSSRTESSGFFFVGVSLGKTLQSQA